MAVADGSVDIRITGSVDPSVAASANEAKVSLNGLGASAASLRPGFDASASSLKLLIAQTGSFAAAQKALAAANGDMTAALAATAAGEAVVNTATKVTTASALNSRSVYEGLALVHEAMAGRFTRMASTSLIFGQAVAGQSAVLQAAQFATSAYGLAILGTVAVVGLAIAATVSYENEQKNLTATTLGLGAQSGITAEQLKQIGESANTASQSIRETTKAAEAFAGAGLHDAQTVKVLSNSVEAYSQLIGGKFADAEKKLAAAMKDPVKGAKDLHEELGILDGDQIEQIQTLTALGEKDQAVAIITQAFNQRIEEARKAGVGLRGEFGQLIDDLSNVYEKIAQVTTGFGREAETLLEDLIPALHQAGQAHRDAAAAASQQAQNEAALNNISAKGAAAYDNTPEGRAAKEKTELQGNLSAAQDALKVDIAVHGEHSEVVKRDRQAVEDYTHAVTTYLTPVEKKLKADRLDVELAAAKHSHNKQLVADLTEQKTLIEESGKIESAADAKALSASKGDVAGAKTFAPKGGKGPSIASEWQEQLHAAEIASNDFFADQTQKELEFWQSKVGLVKVGSKQWLEVQTHIYDAQKTLAHKDYDEHIADLNDRIEADRNDLTKFKADWQEKLDFIKDKFKEESTEYKDAHRQMIAEERQFQDRLIQEELTGNNKAITALKQHLTATRQLRQTEASTTEALIKDQADGEVLGEVKAATQIAQVHQQLANQEIADAQAVFNKEEALRQQGLADALAADGANSVQYRTALQQDVDAYQAFQDQIRQLEARSTQQQITDIIAVKNAYAGYISGTVNATITGLDGMLSKTMNWRQALIGVYQSIVQSFEAALAKMATRWVVQHVLMTATQRAQLTIQNAQHAASEAIKTGATTAGVATRAGVENTGFFAQLLKLLGISVGHHVASETVKTAATTTGVTTRAASETAAATASAAAQHVINANMVVSYSGVAGAAGTASYAAAPWPIDMGAPAFGAAMAADAGSYAALAALDTGTNYMPRDQVVQMHEGERVIPKADNQALMEALRLGGGGHGDVHLHYAPTVHERERMGLKQLLANDSRDMVEWINESVRLGKLNLKAA